jgi:hypothetical protein
LGFERGAALTSGQVPGASGQVPGASGRVHAASILTMRAVLVVYVLSNGFGMSAGATDYAVRLKSNVP